MKKIRIGKKPPQRPIGTRQRPTATTSMGKRSFSYYASQRSVPTARESHLKRGEAHEKFDKRTALKKWAHRMSMLAISIVLLASIVSILEVDTKPRVVVLNESEGYALHAITEYQATATDVLRSSVFNSNKITIDTTEVAQTVQQSFPEINDTSLALPLLGHRPTLYIELTKPTLILQNGGQRILVDSQGHALSTSTSLKDVSQLQLPTLTDQSNLTISLGDTVMSSSTITFVRTVLAQLDAAGVSVKRMVMPSRTEELDVYITGDSYFGKFNLHDGQTVRQQVGTFLATRQQLSRGKQGSRVPSQYIDVRIPGRAYYK